MLLPGNATQRHNMLLVQLEITPGYAPVCLLNQVFQMLLNTEVRRETGREGRGARDRDRDGDAEIRE